MSKLRQWTNIAVTAALLCGVVFVWGDLGWSIMDNPRGNAHPIAAVVLSSSPAMTVPIEVAGVPSYREEQGAITVRVEKFGTVVTVHDLTRGAAKPGDCVWVNSNIEVERQGLLLRGKTFPTDGLEGATWRCFHCGFETADPKEAAGHFGDHEEGNSLCMDWRDLDADGRASEYQSVCGELTREREENLRLRNCIEGLEHRLLGFEDLTYSRFKVRSINDAYNKYDSMEGRALAAEEQLTAMRPKLEAAEGMAAALRIMIESAFPHPVEHPTMTAAWKVAREALAHWDEASKTVMGEEAGNA